MLRLFDIPLISPASTSERLSDQKDLLFARTVPSDRFQANALVDIVKKFKWTYVSIVASDDEYGIGGARKFREKAENNSICIAVEERVYEQDENTYNDVRCN